MSKLTHRNALILLSRDGMACGTGGSPTTYNLPLHIAALFIILTVSTAACAFPLLILRAPRLRIPPTFLFTVRHFGTGVLIATAFVHLLPTAFISLTDPCLPAFWNEQYPAMAGALAMAAVFGIGVVEMVFSPGRNCCAFPGDVVSSGGQGDPDKLGALRGRESSTGRELQRVTQNSADLDAIERVDTSTNINKTQDFSLTQEESTKTSAETQKHKKALLQCLLLEMGILFHSVFIGMALSVAAGNDFVVLLIAISFHQTFEGLALGSRIAALTWKPRAYQPWFMALAYGCTTPIGQAIGLATHTLYSPDSEVGLLMVGIMNAISAGLLTFTSLVDLMSEDFLSDESWRVLNGRRRVVACLLVFGGGFGMSLIGAWA